MPNTLTRRSLGAGAAALALIGSGARAQGAYPNKPIRLILPLSAGSTVDILTRKLSDALSTALGQPLVIENNPGAGGVVGTAQIARADKDGYTLGMVSSNHVVVPHVIKDVSWNATRDFTPISVVAGSGLALVVNAESPYRTAQELIAAARARPGDITYGSSGNGTILHLASVLFAKEAGIDLKHVPYKGVAPMVNDLLGNVIQCVITSSASVQSHVAAGRLRILAVSTRKREPSLPNIPSLAEVGLVNYDYAAWIAMIGPADLPAAVVERLQTALKTVLGKPDTKEALDKLGLSIIGSDAATAKTFFESELTKHGDLVRLSGAKAE